LTNVGLGPVVQVIDIVVEAVTMQFTLSITTVFSLDVAENPVPCIVTLVPPAVVPLDGTS